MKSQKIEVFEHPELYKLIFSLRMYNEEIDFIDSIKNKYLSNRTKVDILDLGAGDGEISSLLKSKGYHVICMDKSFPMCLFAKNTYTLHVIQGDFTHFHFNKKFDFILCLFNSITYITKLEMLIKHFTLVKKHLKKNGFYIIEMNYPRYLDKPFEMYEWTCYNDSFDEFQIKFFREAPVNYEDQTIIEKVIIHDKKNDCKYSAKYKKLFLFPNEIKLIITLIGGMKVIRFFEHPDLESPLNKCKNPLHCYVLIQKT